MILAAALGVLGGAGAASAQTPQPMPTTPGGLPAVAAPTIVAQAQPAPAAPAPAAPYAPAPVAGGCCGSVAPAPSDCGGCDSGCGGKHGARGGLLGHLCNSRLAIGEGCANPVTCGTCASERTFLFGGCHQFFSPGNKCGSGHVLGSGCGGACGGGWGGGCGGGGLLHHGNGCGDGRCGGGLLGGCRGCPFHPLGTSGLCSPPCSYFSYLNR